MDDPNLKKIENSEDTAGKENETAESILRRFEREQLQEAERKQFQKEFYKLDYSQRGGWGESVVVNEAKETGHIILIEHSDVPLAHGFDCVSYDQGTSTLHIWEAKNFGARSLYDVNTDNVTAWKDEIKSGTKYADSRPAYEKNWKAVLDSSNESVTRDDIKLAIAEGRVVFHVRIGPDTKISNDYQQELETSQVPGATYDWKRYTYSDMLKSRPEH